MCHSIQTEPNAVDASSRLTRLKQRHNVSDNKHHDILVIYDKICRDRSEIRDVPALAHISHDDSRKISIHVEYSYPISVQVAPLKWFCGLFK